MTKIDKLQKMKNETAELMSTIEEDEVKNMCSECHREIDEYASMLFDVTLDELVEWKEHGICPFCQPTIERK